MNKELKFLIRIVKKASKLIKSNFQVMKKGDVGDLVTNIDIEIEKYIVGKIKKSYPNFDIVSEEFNSKNTLTDNCFVLDPIDGTVNFANGVPLWGIQIACIKNKEICACVIYLPKLKEFYYADESGAYLNNKKLNIKDSSTQKYLYTFECAKDLSFYNCMPNHEVSFRKISSAAVNYSWVAKGCMGGTIFLKNSLWDYLPGEYLVKQAGGFIIEKNNIHIAAKTEEFANILLKEIGLKNLEK